MEGTRSKVNAALPVTLAVYLPDGASISRYQLLRFHPVDGARQFRSLNGGVLKAGEATRDEIEFKPEKISPQVYTITIESALGTGEYGIMPQSAGAPQSENGKSGKESTGKIYTVSVAQ